MITESSVEIDAPAAIGLGRLRRRRALAGVDGVDHAHRGARRRRSIEVGKRFAIKQPPLPKLVWEVTEVEPGASWTWRQRSPGGQTLGVHEVVPLGAGRTLVRQRIDQRGPLGALVGVLMRRLTERYLGHGGRRGSRRAASSQVAAPALTTRGAGSCSTP